MLWLKEAAFCRNRTTRNIIEEEINYLIGTNLRDYRRVRIEGPKIEERTHYRVLIRKELGERVIQLKKKNRILSYQNFAEFVILKIIKDTFGEEVVKSLRVIDREPKERTVGAKRAAEIAGFRSRSRINQMCIAGQIPGAYKTTSGYWRIPIQEAHAIKRKYKDWPEDYTRDKKTGEGE